MHPFPFEYVDGPGEGCRNGGDENRIAAVLELLDYEGRDERLFDLCKRRSPTLSFSSPAIRLVRLRMVAYPGIRSKRVFSMTSRAIRPRCVRIATPIRKQIMSTSKRDNILSAGTQSGTR